MVHEELLHKLARLESENLRLRALTATRVKTAPDALAEFEFIRNEEQEHFVVLCLDARHGLLHKEVIAKGTVSHVDCHPRDAFRAAIRVNAKSIILGHNHPSGDHDPSQADKEMTWRFVEAGKLLGIPVLDHFVVSFTGFTSLAQEGLMSRDRR